jgi:tRNA dimethylallyltransferase
VTRHLAIVGATASGKSALAYELACAAGDVELISLDSMQVYRGMDIGTAKPSPDERAAVVHHLIDVADPADEWSVRATQRGVRAALADIEARGRRAILVGGTGLYVRTVVDDLDVPPTDPEVRHALEAQVAEPDGLAAAYARLQQLDPDAAARIEPANERRIVRALEVIEVTGRGFSSFGPGLDAYGPPALDVQLFGIDRSREELARSIDARVDAMRAAGLIDEVRALRGRPGGLSRTAAQAIGYKELLAALDRGDAAIDAAFAETARRTRQFARRQRMWFQRDPRITWLAPGNKIDRLVAAVLARWPDPIPASS